MKNEKTITFPIDGTVDSAALFGSMDRNVKAVERATGTTIIQRNSELLIQGEEGNRAREMLTKMAGELKATGKLDSQKADYIIEALTREIPYDEQENARDIICYTITGNPFVRRRSDRRNMWMPFAGTTWCSAWDRRERERRTWPVPWR